MAARGWRVTGQGAAREARMNRQAMRRVTAVAVMAVAVTAGTAQAATVSLEGRVLRLTAGAGEANDVTVTVSSSQRCATVVQCDLLSGVSAATVHDAVGGLEAGEGCTVAAGDVVCTATQRDLELAVDLGDGNDSFSSTGHSFADVHGGAGDDTLTAADARLSGEDGDDRLTNDAQGSRRGDLQGGAGADVLVGNA